MRRINSIALPWGSAISRKTTSGDSEIRACVVAADGRTIVAGEVNGHVHFLKLEGLATVMDK
jgi:hypothetical protein